MEQQIRKNLISLNELMNAIFGMPMRISTILAREGFNAEQIAILQGDELPRLLDYIEIGIQSVLLGYSNNGRLIHVIYHRYGLFGREKQTLQKIGDNFGVTRERIRQLENKALRKINPKTFSNILILSAGKILKIDLDHGSYLKSNSAEEDNQILLVGDVAKEKFSITKEMQLEIDALKKINLKTFRNIFILSAGKTLKIDLDHGSYMKSNSAEEDNQILLVGDVAKENFSITEEMKNQGLISSTPLSLREFVKKINSLRPVNMERLSRKIVKKYLLQMGFLEYATTQEGVMRSLPTAAGLEIGITAEQKDGVSEPYIEVLYNESAQSFIIDNMEGILVFASTMDLDSKEWSGRRWTKSQEKCLVDLFQQNVPIHEIANTLKRTSGATRSRLRKLGLIE